MVVAWLACLVGLGREAEHSLAAEPNMGELTLVESSDQEVFETEQGK